MTLSLPTSPIPLFQQHRASWTHLSAQRIPWAVVLMQATVRERWIHLSHFISVHKCKGYPAVPEVMDATTVFYSCWNWFKKMKQREKNLVSTQREIMQLCKITLCPSSCDLDLVRDFLFFEPAKPLVWFSLGLLQSKGQPNKSQRRQLIFYSSTCILMFHDPKQVTHSIVLT